MESGWRREEERGSGKKGGEGREEKGRNEGKETDFVGGDKKSKRGREGGRAETEREREREREKERERKRVTERYVKEEDTCCTCDISRVVDTGIVSCGL